MHAGASTVYTLSVGGVTWKTALKEDRCVCGYVCMCVCVNGLAKQVLGITSFLGETQISTVLPSLYNRYRVL